LSKEWFEVNVNKFKNGNCINNTIDTSVQPLPPILILENNEKFIDVDGNILDIEVRSEKDINKIYFKVKDISDKFKLDNIRNTITHNNSIFNNGIHYTYFNSRTSENFTGGPNRLYLTFKGLTKIIYVSMINKSLIYLSSQ